MKRLVCLFAIMAPTMSFALDSKPSFQAESIDYGVVVPVVSDTPTPAIAGQIFFNLSSHSFEGITNTGNTATLAVEGSNSVTSGGTERIERATFTNNGTVATAVKKSSSWADTASITATGKVTITAVANTWTDAPTCVCNATGVPTSYLCATEVTYSSPTATIVVGTRNTQTAGDINAGFSVICMGPR